eukprot:1161401-Pelagomonas_calceolata.AAC.14
MSSSVTQGLFGSSFTAAAAAPPAGAEKQKKTVAAPYGSIGAWAEEVLYGKRQAVCLSLRIEPSALELTACLAKAPAARLGDPSYGCAFFPEQGARILACMPIAHNHGVVIQVSCFPVSLFPKGHSPVLGYPGGTRESHDAQKHQASAASHHPVLSNAYSAHGRRLRKSFLLFPCPQLYRGVGAYAVDHTGTLKSKTASGLSITGTTTK